MKNIFVLFVVFYTQFSNANWMTSFEDAQKMSLASNKFMLVDFWATWCGPCKKMDMDSWSNQEIIPILDSYVPVKIDIDVERQIASKYGIESIPNMFIMDGNGKVVYSFMGYRDPNQLKSELLKFAFSTDFLSNELINYFKVKNFNTSLRVFQKYLDYSLLVDKESESKVRNVAQEYLDDAKKELNKKDESYEEKKQKLDILSLYDLAYQKKFDKLSKKLESFIDSNINESNMGIYNFLKYISLKSQEPDNMSIDEKFNKLDGFSYYIEKANMILDRSKN